MVLYYKNILKANNLINQLFSEPGYLHCIIVMVVLGRQGVAGNCHASHCGKGIILLYEEEY